MNDVTTKPTKEIAISLSELKDLLASAKSGGVDLREVMKVGDYVLIRTVSYFQAGQIKRVFPWGVELAAGSKSVFETGEISSIGTFKWKDAEVNPVTPFVYAHAMVDHFVTPHKPEGL